MDFEEITDMDVKDVIEGDATEVEEETTAESTQTAVFEMGNISVVESIDEKIKKCVKEDEYKQYCAQTSNTITGLKLADTKLKKDLTNIDIRIATTSDVLDRLIEEYNNYTETNNAARADMEKEIYILSKLNIASGIFMLIAFIIILIITFLC